MSSSYLSWYADIAHVHWLVPTGYAQTTFTDLIWDSNRTVAGPCGSRWAIDRQLQYTGGLNIPLYQARLLFSPAVKG